MVQKLDSLFPNNVRKMVQETDGSNASADKQRTVLLHMQNSFVSLSKLVGWASPDVLLGFERVID